MKAENIKKRFLYIGYALSIIAIFFSSISIVYNCDNHKEWALQKARVDSAINLLTTTSFSKIEKDSIINDLKIQKSKEDLYLSQLSVQSDTTIMYVTILFGLFGFINFLFIYEFFYKSLNTKIINLNIDTKKNIAAHDNNYKTHISDLEVQQSEIILLKANTFNIIANSFPKDQLSQYLDFKLHAIDSIFNFHSKYSKSSDSRKMIIGILMDIKASLSEIDIENDHVEVLEIHNDRDKYNAILKVLVVDGDKEISNMAIDIMTLLKSM